MCTAEKIYLIITVAILVPFIMTIVCAVIKRIRVGRYCDMLGIGCTVSRVIEPRNPFEKREIDEYVVVDKKWDHKGVCWVKLHRPFDKDLTCFDKTMEVEDLYDRKYVISYKK